MKYENEHNTSETHSVRKFFVGVIYRCKL